MHPLCSLVFRPWRLRRGTIFSLPTQDAKPLYSCRRGAAASKTETQINHRDAMHTARQSRNQSGTVRPALSGSRGETGRTPMWWRENPPSLRTGLKPAAPSPFAHSSANHSPDIPKRQRNDWQRNEAAASSRELFHALGAATVSSQEANNLDY